MSSAGDGMGGGGGGGLDEFGGVDPNMDPELAMALRVSMEEERARQVLFNFALFLHTSHGTFRTPLSHHNRDRELPPPQVFLQPCICHPTHLNPQSPKPWTPLLQRRQVHQHRRRWKE